MAKYYFFSRELAKRRPGLNRIGWRIEAWAIAALVGVFRLLPLERATRLAHWLFQFGASSKQRQRVMRNLYVAFPDAPAEELDAIARDIFGNVGVALAEIAQIGAIWKDREKRLEFVVSPDVRMLRERGRPAVFVTAHIGPWTLTNYLAAEYDFPLSIVYAAESNPYVHDMMLRLRGELPARLLARDNSMRTLIKELSRRRRDRARFGRASGRRRNDPVLRPRHADEYGARAAGAAFRLRTDPRPRRAAAGWTIPDHVRIRRSLPTIRPRARPNRRPT